MDLEEDGRDGSALAAGLTLRGLRAALEGLAMDCKRKTAGESTAYTIYNSLQ